MLDVLILDLESFGVEELDVETALGTLVSAGRTCLGSEATYVLDALDVGANFKLEVVGRPIERL